MFWKWSQRPFPVAPDERSPPPSRYTQERGPGNGHRWHHWTCMSRIRINSQKLQVMVVLQVNNFIWLLGLGGTGVASYPQNFRQIFDIFWNICLQMLPRWLWLWSLWTLGIFTPPPSSTSKLLSKGAACRSITTQAHHKLGLPKDSWKAREEVHEHTWCRIFLSHMSVQSNGEQVKDWNLGKHGEMKNKNMDKCIKTMKTRTQAKPSFPVGYIPL